MDDKKLETVLRELLDTADHASHPDWESECAHLHDQLESALAEIAELNDQLADLSAANQSLQARWETVQLIFGGGYLDRQ